MEDFDAAVGARHNARNLAMGLARNTIERQDAVVHLEDAILDHDYAVHVLFHVELSNALVSAVHIKFHVLLERLHIELLIGTRQHELQIVDGADFLGSYVNNEAWLALLAHSHVERLLDGLEDEAGLAVE